MCKCCTFTANFVKTIIFVVFELKANVLMCHIFVHFYTHTFARALSHTKFVSCEVFRLSCRCFCILAVFFSVTICLRLSFNVLTIATMRARAERVCLCVNSQRIVRSYIRSFFRFSFLVSRFEQRITTHAFRASPLRCVKTDECRRIYETKENYSRPSTNHAKCLVLFGYVCLPICHKFDFEFACSDFRNRYIFF